MKVHLVGGFTGSGKTTAIEKAREILAENNVITSAYSDKEEEYFRADCPKNDFNEFNDFDESFEKVTGGCFCCNYTDLDSQIDKLKNESGSVLFGDYGGTCTNLISTLLKPLKDYKGAEIELANFSTFVDAKLLLFHLKGMRVPLSLDSKYIWDRHLEESEILIINKIDLLQADDLEDLKKLAKQAFSLKKLLFQNSLDKDSVRQWVELISTSKTSENAENDRFYGNNIAWLDEEIQIVTEDDSAIEVAYDFMHKVSNDLVDRGLTIEHLKFLLYDDNQALKLNYTQFLNGYTAELQEYEKNNTADLLMNARIQTSHAELRKFLFDLLSQFKSKKGVKIVEKFISYFEK
jgi:G3E family GTPase